MSKRAALRLGPRKQPRQARAVELVDAILKSAIRVLEREGGAAFTTIRVAKVAGVSVGSLYQYFPNKHAILFRLQQDEWQATSRLLDRILTDVRQDARARLRTALVTFFETERAEATLRRALAAAGPFHETAQSEEQRASRRRLLRGLIREVAPDLSPERGAFAADLYVALLAGMGEHVSETQQSRTEVARWAHAIADMFLGYLTGHGQRRPGSRGVPYERRAARRRSRRRRSPSLVTRASALRRSREELLPARSRKSARAA